MKSSFRKKPLALAIAFALTTPVASAATINVTAAAVDNAKNGNCSLVEAIVSANSDTSIDNCTAGSGTDLLILPTGSDFLLETVDNSTDGPNGLPSVTSTITIQGEGSGATIRRDSYAPEFRLFHVATAGDLTLEQTTVSGGYSYYYGGGLHVSGNLTLNNSTVSGNSAASFGSGGGLYASSNSTVTLANSTVSGNSAYQGGGLDISGSATLTNSTISGNSAGTSSYGRGGGIYISGAVTLTNSTISGNISGDLGGGFNLNQYSSATLTNSTVSGNSSGHRGGGFHLDYGAEATLMNSTVSGNSANDGGGFYGRGYFYWGYYSYYIISSYVTLTNSTVSGNSASSSYGGGAIGGLYHSATITESILANNSPSECVSSYYGTGIDGGDNWITDSTCSGISAGLGSINLGPLADNSGPTHTHALLAGSAAIDAVAPDAGGNCLYATDQRGVDRPFGDKCDIGAFEVSPITLSVSNLDDSGDGSLRQAIDDANAYSGNDIISFASGVSGTIPLSNGQLLITDSMTLRGPGAQVLAISGNGISQVFQINPGAGGTVTLEGLTIKDGDAGVNGGGGILVDSGDVTIRNSAIINNTSDDGGGGGGLRNMGNGVVTIFNTTVADNMALNAFNEGDGGGLRNDMGKLVLINSTVSTNTSATGGGITNASSAYLEVSNSTITRNNALYGGGGVDNSGAFTMANSIASGNTAPSDKEVAHYGSPTFSTGHNVFGENGASGVTAGVTLDPSDLVLTGAVDTLLDGLADNGGPTQTHLPVAGGAAVNAGDNTLIPTGVSTDQRGDGFPRIIGGTVDIGAVEAEESAKTLFYMMIINAALKKTP